MKNAMRRKQNAKIVNGMDNFFELLIVALFFNYPNYTQRGSAALTC